MFRILIFITWLASANLAYTEIEGDKFSNAIKEAVLEYSKDAEGCVLVENILDLFAQEGWRGEIKPNSWEAISGKDFQTYAHDLRNRQVSWKPSNVSALADKGGSLIVFFDKKGEALFGLMNLKRWKKNQFQVVCMSGNINSSLSFEGTVQVAFLAKDRVPLRDVPYVLELKGGAKE